MKSNKTVDERLADIARQRGAKVVDKSFIEDLEKNGIRMTRERIMSFGVGQTKSIGEIVKGSDFVFVVKA